jgi:uncharacterized protein involved in exopolysaccharide biosynthesis
VIPGKQYTPADMLAILHRRKWLIVFPFIIVAMATFAGTRRLPNRYRSETLILVVPQRVPESYVRATVTAGSRIGCSPTVSRSQPDASGNVIQEFNLYERQRRDGIMEDIVDRMRARRRAGRQRRCVPRQLQRRDPRTVMRVTESLASLFIEKTSRSRRARRRLYQFLDFAAERRPPAARRA